MKCNECGETGLSESAYKRNHGVQHHPTPKMLASRNKQSLDESKMTFADFLDAGRHLETEVKSRAEKGSPHFFDADTMRFFSSRVTDLMWEKGDNIYFITSEQDKGGYEHSGSTRAYTVRVIDAKGDITEIGDFQEHEKLNDARRSIHDELEGSN